MEKPPKLVDTHELMIESTSVDAVLAEIKKRVKAQKIRILVGDDYSYVQETTLPLPARDITKEIVKERIQEIIPENLDDTLWEYSVIHSTDATTRIQVFILTKRFIEAFSDPLKSSGISIEHIEPVSFALNRLTRPESNPHIIVHNAETCEMVFVNEGTIWATEIIGVSSINEKLKEFLTFIKNIVDIDVHHIIYSDYNSGEALQLNDPRIIIQQKKLDPMMGLALKGEKASTQADPLPKTIKEESPKEQTSLPVATAPSVSTPSSLPTPSQADTDDIFATPLPIPQTNKNSFMKIFIISFVVTVIVAAIGGFVLWNKRSSTPFVDLTPTPTRPVVETPTAAPTQAQINKAELKVQVLNGSGTAGEAGRVESLLEADGFETIETGNADNYDYAETIIQLKASLPTEFFNQIENVLVPYEVEAGETLTDDSDYDVVVIVGSTKTEDAQ